MKLHFIITLLLFKGFLSFGQSVSKINKLYSCQENWNYGDLSTKFDGTVLFYAQPITYCGNLSVASTALIKLNNGEIIRVLTLCNNKPDINSPSEFKVGNKVKIEPAQKPSFRVDEIPLDPKSCTIKKTYFGNIKKG